MRESALSPNENTRKPLDARPRLPGTRQKPLERLPTKPFALPSKREQKSLLSWTMCSADWKLKSVDKTVA